MPRRSTTHLIDQLIRDLPCPQKGAVITYDDIVPGFGIRVTKGGARAFVLNYVISGLERRMTIGQFPTWPATAAREEAKTLRKKVDRGLDPLKVREDERDAPTVHELFERYEKEHLPRKRARSAADDRSMWVNIVLPRLGTMKAHAVTPSDIDALHAAVSAKAPVRANRVVEVVRKAFNLAIRWGWRQDNPASGVQRNPEQPRARYLNGEEMMKLSAALAAHPEKDTANAIKLLMFTGARRSEVLGATWTMFDLERGVWTKPSAHTKQQREHRVPLSAAAVQLLREMKKGPTGSFLFPADVEKVRRRRGTSDTAIIAEQPLTELKRAWLSVCRVAGLAVWVEKKTKAGRPVLDRKSKPVMVWKATVRIHDLRHSYASVLASGGESLPIIGALLGHTQPGTTARYAHLLDDTLRAATERVGALVTGNGAAHSESTTAKPDGVVHGSPA